MSESSEYPEDDEPLTDDNAETDDEYDTIDPTEMEDVGGTSAADAQPETRDEEIERLRAETAEAEKRVLLAQAEAENFRKRMRRDFEDQLKYAAVPLVADLLQVRDNLNRALDAAATSADAAGLKEGVEMVAKLLDDTLSKYGVLEIPAEGQEFDPNVHEAISQMPSDDHPSGKVAHVTQIGFQMHDRVVRPSQVVVSTGSA